MKRITTSSSNAYRACNRLYQLRYVEGVRSRDKAHALHFGTLWHGMQELWWVGSGRSGSLAAALVWLDEQPDVDPFDRVKLRELMRGYDARWGDSHLRAVRIEQEFTAPLLNPETGAASRTFVLAGKKDLVAEDHEGVWLVEHKTSGADITQGSNYWQALRMDSQISNYYVGSRANGHDIVGCIYDVVGKPKTRPHKATPEADRKYTAPAIKPRLATPEDKRRYTKSGELVANQRDRDESPEEFAVRLAEYEAANPEKVSGKLYAGQREHDETPDEYAVRLREHIADNPDTYYQRAPVFRLEAEEREAARDMWHTARAIRDAERLNSWPRNPGACFRWNRQCDYWDVCTGQADITDPYRFERVRPHEELSKENAEQTTNGESNGSNSSQRTFPTDVAGVDF